MDGVIDMVIALLTCAEYTHNAAADALAAIAGVAATSLILSTALATDAAIAGAAASINLSPAA